MGCWEVGKRRKRQARQRMGSWDVGKMSKYKDNDKEETTTAPLNFSASNPLIFQKGDVIIKRVEFGVWRVELTANDKDKTTRAALSCQASELPSCQKGDVNEK